MALGWIDRVVIRDGVRSTFQIFQGSSANSVGGDSGQDRRPETDRHSGASLSLYTYMYPRLYPIYLRPTMNNRAIMEGATSLTLPSIAFSSRDDRAVIGKMSCGGRVLSTRVELGRVWSGNFGDRDDRVDRIDSGNPP
ncbi:hypothetical protein DPMN_086449 [Dreissena polymorpha]|uniref:Uncharacterized protein n=1 Tax=Dreissena polymorpha TaxID=45954 RepID=A0A9D4KR77_DREPO|nr:hypothetical protein DPMN_086449 [Dreissena polymorpha]